MSTTAADVMLPNLHRWGVDVVFGLPGDGINGLMEALRKARHARSVPPVTGSMILRRAIES